MGSTVHVSHSSNDSNVCSALNSISADTAHKSSTSRCSQRYIDATGVTALSTDSCEDSYDDTFRNSREASDAAAAAQADTTASIIVTSTQSPRRSVTQRYTAERYMYERFLSALFVYSASLLFTVQSMQCIQ
jgi:hypothetical protein